MRLLGTRFKPIDNREDAYSVVFSCRPKCTLYMYDCFTVYCDLFSEVKHKNIKIKILKKKGMKDND